MKRLPRPDGGDVGEHVVIEKVPHRFLVRDFWAWAQRGKEDVSFERKAKTFCGYQHAQSVTVLRNPNLVRMFGTKNLSFRREMIYINHKMQLSGFVKTANDKVGFRQIYTKK